MNANNRNRKGGAWPWAAAPLLSFAGAAGAGVPQAELRLPPLPYALDALDPFISIRSRLSSRFPRGADATARRSASRSPCA